MTRVRHENVHTFLIAVCQSAHARHDTEHVVVRREHIHGRRRDRANRVVGHRQEERRVINARQVARAAGLVLLGLESERVHVDARRGDVRVVLEGLDLVEIAALAHLEAIVAVELEERRHARVLARHALDTRDGVARLQDGAVPPVAEVERLLSLPRVDVRVGAGHERITLDNPHKLLTGVVEVELELVGGRRDGLGARELERLDEVLVRDLGELAALVRIEVDVVHVEGGRLEVGRRHTVADRVVVGRDLGRHVPAEVAEVVELEVDADLVVLERDQREGKARVAAEPELERDIERVRRRAVDLLVRRVGLTTRAVIVARLATLDEEVRQDGHIANHLGIAGLLARLLRELIPDVHPVTVVLVDALATDLNLDGLDKVVSNPVEPAELRTRAVRRLERHRGERRLEIHAVDQITVALDRARNALAEARRAVERVLDGLHGEVRVAAVHDLEESNLGVAREVHILGAVGDELHQTTTCHLLYPFSRNNFQDRGGFWQSRGLYAFQSLFLTISDRLPGTFFFSHYPRSSY